MRRLRLPATLDAVALLGVTLLAIAAGSRFGWEAGAALVGLALVAYAVLAARGEAVGEEGEG